MSLVLRSEKGSALSFAELDGNFQHLLDSMKGLDVLEDPNAKRMLQWNPIPKSLEWMDADAVYAKLSGATFTGDVAIDKTTPKFQALHDGNTDYGGLGMWDQAQNHGMYLYMFGASHAQFPNQTAMYSWNATDGTKRFFVAEKDKGVALYYNGVSQFQTLAAGVGIIDQALISSQYTAKNAYCIVNAATDFIPNLLLRINNVNQGQIYAASGNFVFRNHDESGATWFQYYNSGSASWRTHIKMISNGALEMYYGTNKVFATMEDGIQANNRLSCRSDGTGDVGILELLDTGSSRYWRWSMRGTDHASEADDLVLSHYNGSSVVDWLKLDVSASWIMAIKQLRVRINTPNDLLQFLWSIDRSYTGTILKMAAERDKSSAFNHIQCYSTYANDKVFQVRGDGQVTADGSFSGGGADRAEMFEWADGNPDAEDRDGRSVVLIGDKIRLATTDDDPATIFGIVSASPDSIGNAFPCEWRGKYERDSLGRKILDKDSKLVLSAGYDSKRAYTPRTERPEWAPVALLGRVRVWKGEPLNPGWRELAEDEATLEVLLGAWSPNGQDNG